MARRRYDDKFRASAVIMLEAQGYPDKKGSLTSVAKHLKMPATTLRNWYHSQHNPAPSELRYEKKGDLIALLKSEVQQALASMDNVRDEATYQQLTVGIGIMLDKLQILEGNPTQIIDVTNSDPKSKLIGYLDSIATRDAESEGVERPN